MLEAGTGAASAPAAVAGLETESATVAGAVLTPTEGAGLEATAETEVAVMSAAGALSSSEMESVGLQLRADFFCRSGGFEEGVAGPLMTLTRTVLAFAMVFKPQQDSPVQAQTLDVHLHHQK